MAREIDELSVFLPAYNEEGTIENVILSVKRVVSKIAGKWEIIVVNDGSTDRTGKIAARLSMDDPRIRVVSHSKNEGYGVSLKTGFYNSRYKWISFMDSDGQFDFSEIVNFIQKQKETDADLVIGYYKKRKVSLSKIITSKIWEYVVFLMFGLNIKDIDCGFKLVSRKVIEKIPKLESSRGAFISSELLIKSKKEGFKIVQVPVTHYPRLKGRGTGRNLNVVLRSFVDLFRLWKRLR
jgi:glycosyltransferase involved in cell wall biosynthesis